MLADAQKRGLYDRFGHAGVNAGAGAAGFDPTIFADFSDIFSGLGDMFGFGDILGGGRRRRGGPQRGSDLRYDLEITFEESADGTETSIVDSARRDLRDLQRLRRGRGHAARDLRAVPRHRPAALPAGLSHRRAPLLELPRAPARRSPSRARRAAAPAASRASASSP